MSSDLAQRGPRPTPGDEQLMPGVRSFLMLGTGFLFLSLLTMIWHAATNLGWTWV
ncbi:MAG: hypothetical protein JW741_31570 [Sedimentisphaerales bacterium]|nr:hypothetical protein [Sedimentisphaerales bacterium]